MNYTTTKINESVKLRDSDDGIVPTTVIDCFQETVKNYGSRRALVYQDGLGKEWKSHTWGEYYDQTKLLARGFINIGFKKGEGVAILGFNSPQWFMSNMAAIMAGGISVGIYTTNSPHACEYIIKDSNSTIVVVENDEQLQKILSLKDSKKLRAIIQYKDQLKDNENLPDNVYNWDGFLQYTNMVEPDWKLVIDRIEGLEPNKCSSLIYTSGTTGKPKGVMLSHDNITWTTKIILETHKLSPDVVERVVSYLPLSHIAAQMVDMYMPLVNGSETWFAQPTALKGTLKYTLNDANPTIFLGVPRVWEKIMERMKETGRNITGLKKKISTKAKKMGLARNLDLEKGKTVTPWGWTLANMLVFNKVREALGLTKCKLFLTGAAPISMETLEYFASLNISLYEIYGMSESSGPMTMCYTDNIRMSSCGKVIPHTKLDLAPETNEVITFGRHVMMGYLNQPDKTAKAIDKDGWLHSEDIGKIDNDGFLHIVGRMKEILVTAGGENVPPVYIENNIKAELPIVSNCMVVGDKKKFLTVLISLKTDVDEDGDPTDVLEKSTLSDYQSLGSKIITVSQAIKDERVKNYIREGINHANKKSISNAQKVQKFRFLPKDFSINGGELGPTLKLKRSVVLNKYKYLVEDMYKQVDDKSKNNKIKVKSI